MSSLVHFLLVYSHAEERLVDKRQFVDGAEATQAYRDAEAEYGKDYEIVLVGADSIETIQRTHGHYFMVGAGNVPAFI